MNLRLVRPFLLASAFSLLSATVSEARCVVDVEGQWRVIRKSYPNVSVFQILVETVDRVPNGQFATVTVQRVWQGHIPRQLTLYNHFNGPDGRDVVVGSRYIIFARNQPDGLDRDVFRIAAERSAYVTDGCGIHLNDDVKKLGRGHAPE
jgi:hypothetical protein